MRYLTILIIVAFTVSCIGNSRQRDAIDQNEILTSRVDSLNQIIVSRDSIIDDALTLLSDVSSSLDEIKRKEGMLLDFSEIKRNSKEKLTRDIDKISILLDNNNVQLKQLDRLKKTLSDNNLKILSLDKLILNLTEDANSRNKMLTNNISKLAELTNEVEVLNNEVEVLSVNNEELLKALGKKELDSQTKYYLYGEEKDLIDRDVLLKDGFFKKTLRLNPNVDYTKFRKININELDSINLNNSKKVILIGNFPSQSYSISKKGNRLEKLTINDKTEFWKGSLILVVAVKGRS